MGFIGNLIWLIFGGFILAIGWFIAGILWCCTIIGIPVGIQCFKTASLALWPFGKEVTNNGRTTSFILNVLWVIFSGIELASAHLVIGLLFCLTVIGTPFGLQHFKLAKLAFMPFGTVIS